APGTTGLNVSISVNGDALNEPDETFFVNLSSPGNAVLARTQGTATITNDDPLPGLSINNLSVAEGNNGTVNAVFTVTLSAASAGNAPGDYSITSGTVTFPPGTSSQTLAVLVNGDALN